MQSEVLVQQLIVSRFIEILWCCARLSPSSTNVLVPQEQEQQQQCSLRKLCTRNARLHHIMKCLKQKTATPIPDLHHLPHEATTGQDKANMLNRFFTQQREQSVADSPPTTPPIHTTPDITSTLPTITTSPAEVESPLKQLNTKKSPGHDGIPTRLLKEAAAELAPSLAVLYNLSFQTGDIPQDWKDATVSPIHEKRCPNLPNKLSPHLPP